MHLSKNPKLLFSGNLSNLHRPVGKAIRGLSIRCGSKLAWLIVRPENIEWEKSSCFEFYQRIILNLKLFNNRILARKSSKFKIILNIEGFKISKLFACAKVKELYLYPRISISMIPRRNFETFDKIIYLLFELSSSINKNPFLRISVLKMR